MSERKKKPHNEDLCGLCADERNETVSHNEKPAVPGNTLGEAREAYLRFVENATFDNAYDAASYVPSLAAQADDLTARLAEAEAKRDEWKRRAELYDKAADYLRPDGAP